MSSSLLYAFEAQIKWKNQEMSYNLYVYVWKENIWFAMTHAHTIFVTFRDSLF